MSLPCYSFNCTSCNFEKNFYFDTAYHFEDTSGEGYAPSLQISWCEDCDRVVTSANPQTPASIAREVELRSTWITEEQNCRRSLFHPLRKANETLIQKWKSEIAHLKMSTEFFRYKGTVSRCLTCGGEKITHIELPDVKAENSSIGIPHHCGGNIYGVSNGRISFSSRPVVKYDLEGKILSDGREDNDTRHLESEDLRAIIAFSGNASLNLLNAAQLSESIGAIVHPDFSILGVYLSAREFLAIKEEGGNAIAVSLHILTNPPYLNQSSTRTNEDLADLRHHVLVALQKYDREANRYFGTGPAPWSNSKESQDFGRAAFQVLFERLSSYPELELMPFKLNIEGIEKEIAKQPEILCTAFHELMKEGDQIPDSGDSLAECSVIESTLNGGLYNGFLVKLDIDKSRVIKCLENEEQFGQFVRRIENRIENDDFDDLLPKTNYEQLGIPRPKHDFGKSSAIRAVFGKDDQPLFTWNGK